MEDALNQKKSSNDRGGILIGGGRIKLTEYSTDLCHGLEDHAGEADSHFDGFHIGKQQQQGFVLGCVAQESIRLCSKKCF